MKDGLSDTVAGAALVGFALVLWFYLIPTFVTEVDFQAEMSPRFFPRLGAILIFGSGLLLFLRSLRSMRSAAERLDRTYAATAQRLSTLGIATRAPRYTQIGRASCRERC